MEALKWICLRRCPSWNVVEGSLPVLSSWKIDVDDVLLIEEVRRITVFVTNARLESWNVNDISTSKRWCEVPPPRERYITLAGLENH